jgi:hypothetical protein
MKDVRREILDYANSVVRENLYQPKAADPGLPGSFDDGKQRTCIGFALEGFACDRFASRRGEK